MAIWIQSLSWSLIYSLLQGLIVFTSLWFVLKLVPATSSTVRYHLSLSALAVLFSWFVATWWQQFHLLSAAPGSDALSQMPVQAQLRAMGAMEYTGSYRLLPDSMLFLFPWLAAFYFLGLSFMVLRLSTGILQLFWLRRTGTTEPATALYELLQSLKDRLHFNGQVQLLISAKARVPIVIGFLKPVILMPVAALMHLSTEQLETILLHELAHIKRHDYLVNLLQSVVETILFFNPFTWLISANVRREREHCCDDLVLDHTREPLFYATALAALAAHPGQVTSLAVAASGQSNHLFHRIKRIMEMKKNQFSYSRMVAAILIIAAITCSIAWLSPSLEHPDKDKKGSVQHEAPQASPDSTFAARQEGNQLVQRLTDDHLISQMNGFFVEKKQNKLFINGAQQPDNLANKYLAGMKEEELCIRVFSFRERLKMHPDASILQILAPTTFSSGCVEYKPAKSGKPGC